MRMLAIVLAIATPACGYRTKQLTIHVTDVAEPSRTRQTNFLVQHVSGHLEDGPGNVPRSEMIDEAWIEQLDGRQACVTVVTRTAAGLDLPLSEWTLSVNGQSPHITSEVKSAWNQSYTSREAEQVLQAEGQQGAVSVVQHTDVERTVQVVERRGTLCVPTPTGVPPQLTLEMAIPQDADGDWGQRFEWHIVAPPSAAQPT